ncbi:hypothetical protein J3E07_001668 [Methanococcus voltae]|uniref:Uncharacterized protein n=1 Tax=Methanococcus voltae TaxID=2188 RepID=A0A8J7UT45_METVO|nr:hypothetical protein [Methanococcus voltae]
MESIILNLPSANLLHFIVIGVIVGFCGLFLDYCTFR